MVNIKVAVRIRPLSERELLHGEKIIVRKENKSVLVTNPKIPERQDGDSRQRTRRFSVDFCYDSSDPEGGTQEAVKAAFPLTFECPRRKEICRHCLVIFFNNRTAKISCYLERVYEEIGSEVLRSMHEGYNACVLAYGHSASGKTHTIMGSRDDPGLTPRLCEGLFDRKRPEEGIRVRVVVSFLEIYNERVRDLLGSEEAPCGHFSLRVREHPKSGPYVQGLSEHSVEDKGNILRLLETGNRRRSTAATENNVHSSRSHAVFTIQFEQSDGDNYDAEKSSKVHLVDLAGSERASSSQSKARLQEGANINKSLATLGNVISALAESYDLGVPTTEHSNSKTWQPFVPYRDSVLTWLLKDTLGGNSNTIMIATVSPAGSCLSETLNTLRYAKRTKKIVNRPIVNEDPKVRTIRELRKEIARLRGLILFRSIEEDDRNKKERRGKNGVEELGEGKREEEEVEEGGKEASAGGDACEIGDEKKSDVNGSVNDNFSHETQFFSDSLESFSSVLKSGNSCDADDDGPGRREAVEEPRTPGRGLTGEFGSSENLSKKDFQGMLHRSRPDLIKGISTRCKEGFALGGGHSCTDISNLSRSTSDNSLNSSGSADAQSSENKSGGRPAARNPRWAEVGRKEKGTGKEGAGNGAVEAASKKKEKRSEIVDAVTSRLYVSKKKSERKAEAPKKEENEEDCGELEEVKLCKRARMKLFDISRKLAMARKMKKTVDCDTQTDFFSGTLRMKEKCVTTEESIPEAASCEENPRGRRKPYVIMNQVFIPRASNYVVECGKVVRVEAPEGADRQETATQTSYNEKRYKNANTSPVKFGAREEDCFSEDSLDSDLKSRSRRRTPPEEGGVAEEAAPEGRVRFKWPPEFQIYISQDPEKPLQEEYGYEHSRKISGERDEILFNGFPWSIFTKETNCSDEESNVIGAAASGEVLESRKSNEDSLASTEDSENTSLSETSSEDFVFYENPKDKAQTTGDRELYTITENSEQSDPSDAFSPVQSRESSLRAAKEFREGEAQKWEDISTGTFRANDSGISTKKNLETFGHDAEETNKTTSLCKSGGKNIQSKPQWAKNEVKIKMFAQVAKTFDHRVEEELKGENSGVAASRDCDRPASGRTACRLTGNPLKGMEAQEKNVRSLSENKDERANRTDFRSNAQKPYLNLNISSSGGVPPFSVDTHLFGRASRKEQSAEAMSASADSITFVFMGPGKPETSVLMEIIGRSLGRGSASGRRKSKSKGVQCDGHLMRSVSVDTAMIALTRIAKNQKPPPEMQRTASLGKLNSDDVVSLLGTTGNLRNRLGGGCRCDLEDGSLPGKDKRCGLKYFIETNAVSNAENMKENKKTEAEKPKKSVSWFGEASKGSRDSLTEPDAFVPETRNVPMAETEESIGPRPSPTRAEADVPERRVRFRKAETWEEESVWSEEGEEFADDWTAFLKEATRLLKNINHRSSNRKVLSEEAIEDFGAEGRAKKVENRRSGSKEPETMSRSRTEGRSESETGRKCQETMATRDRKTQEGGMNLTWPRRRPTAGKPPTGTKPKFQRSLLASHSDGFQSQSWNPRSCFRSKSSDGRAASQCREPFELPEALGEVGRCRRRESEWRGERRLPPFAWPRNSDPVLDLDSVSDLETGLEECCRRLEEATERDKMRETIQREKMDFPREGAEEDRLRPRNDKAIKRRSEEGCAGGCVCSTSGVEPCRRLWSRGCRSTFELDSFGPGSRHCRQLCMFCRRKEAEVYYSAACLNSECSSGLCRLNYYGFCPCSPVKLNQVVLSPRAYMQKLLALRKEIVRGTTRPEEARRKSFSGAATSDF